MNPDPKFLELAVRCVRQKTQLTSIVPNGLVGHWKLDESSGTGIIDYASANDGTVQGGLAPATDSVQGRVGRALAFDGSNDEVIINHSSGLTPGTGDFTTSLWFRAPTGTQSGVLLTKRIDGGSFNQWTLVMSNGAASPGIGDRIAFHLREDTSSVGAYRVFTNDGFADGQWYHLVIVRDSGPQPKMYINGEIYTNTTVAETPSATPVDISNTEPWRIGGNPEGGWFFDGAIDDVRIYNRALSADEIKYLAESFDANVTYDTDARVPKYFNGDDWVSMGERQYVPNAVRINKGDDGDQIAASTHPSVMDPSKSATGSVWFKFNKSDQIEILTDSGNRGLEVYLRTDGSVAILGQNSGNTEILNWGGSAGSNLDDGKWHHLLYSFDLSDPSRYHLYLDGVNIANAPGTFTDEAIDHDTTVEHFKIPANPATSDFNMADFWFFTDTYIDLSVEANRRKFIDEHGQPVYLGADGSLPTGGAPDIFLSGDTDTWHTNKGTGGGFSENGALEDAGSAPGDIYSGINTDGLIGWWKLDETSGTGIIDYASGYDGTVQGNLDPSSDSVGGVFGRALHFDGSNSYITLPDLGVDTNTVSFTAWVRAERLPRDMGVIMDRDPAPSNSEGIFIKGGNLMPHWDNEFPNSGISVPGSEWTLLAVTVSPTEQKGYVVSSSGGFQSYTNSGTFSADTLDTLEIGRDTILSRNFDGAIDDVRIYNRELSAAEVQSLYDAARCTNPDRFAGTMVYNADHNVLQYCDATLPGNGWQATMP